MNKNKTIALCIGFGCAAFYFIRIVLLDYSRSGSDTAFFFSDLAAALLAVSIFFMLLVRLNDRIYNNKNAATVSRMFSIAVALCAAISSGIAFAMILPDCFSGLVSYSVFILNLLLFLQACIWLGLTIGVLIEGLILEGFPVRLRKLLFLFLAAITLLVVVFSVWSQYVPIFRGFIQLLNTEPQKGEVFFVYSATFLLIAFSLFMQIWLIITGVKGYKKAADKQLRAKTWRYL